MNDNVMQLHRPDIGECLAEDDAIARGPVDPVLVAKLRDLLAAAEQGKIRAFVAAAVIESVDGTVKTASCMESPWRGYGYALFTAAHRLMRRLDEWLL